MTSIRNNDEAARRTAERLLDAARESILSVGWKRTTLTDVARRAGRVPDDRLPHVPRHDRLFGDLMTREWAARRRGRRLGRGVRRRLARRESPIGVVRIVAALRDERRCSTASSTSTPSCCSPTCSSVAAAPSRPCSTCSPRGSRRASATAASAPGTRRCSPAPCCSPPTGFVLSAPTMTDAAVGRRPTSTRELAELLRRYLTAMTDARIQRGPRRRPRQRSTSSSSASASPAPASPSTPPPAASSCWRSTPTTSPSAPRAGRASWSTAACATSRPARSGSPTRAPSSAAS